MQCDYRGSHVVFLRINGYPEFEIKLKGTGLNPPTVGQLVSFSWPRRTFSKMMCSVISMIKVVKDNKKSVDGGGSL